MNKSVAFGIAITLATMAMSASAVANPWGIPCTEANLGEVYFREYSWGSREWTCSSTGWELTYVCTSEGCYVP